MFSFLLTFSSSSNAQVRRLTFPSGADSCIFLLREDSRRTHWLGDKMLVSIVVADLTPDASGELLKSAIVGMFQSLRWNRCSLRPQVGFLGCDWVCERWYA